jgi:hypothetical protein
MDNNVSELCEITEQVQSGQLECVWNKNVMKWKQLSFVIHITVHIAKKDGILWLSSLGFNVTPLSVRQCSYREASS